MPVVPNPAVARAAAYAPPRHGAPIDLKLDGNEGAPPPAELYQALEGDPELLRRYPDARAFERLLGERLGVAPERVLVTSGADDALDRACRAFLWAGRELVVPVPTFEMLPRYASLTGCTVREVPWPRGPYPVDDVLAQVSRKTGAVAAVSPNNPTGAVVTRDDFHRLAAGAPHATLFVDLAYAEYADDDLTAVAAELPNAVVFRTLSKAWGLAGLRIGYAVGAPDVIGWMRATGHPYAVASPSLALAARWLAIGEAEVQSAIDRVRAERGKLREVLSSLGVDALPSQANFVLCRPPDAVWLRDGLAGLGIAVRIWPGHPQLDGMVRITCPADAAAFSRLASALRAVLRPEALICEREVPPNVASKLTGGVVTGGPRAAGGAPAWMLCSSPEEVAAARDAGVVPIGLGAAGPAAARVLSSPDELEGLLP